MKHLITAIVIAIFLSNPSFVFAAASATISVPAPPCIVDVGDTYCTTPVTWNKSEAPNAGVFLGDNPNYWTGTVGTKNMIWTTTVPMIIRVRLNKYDPTSTILAQTIAQAVSPSATISIPNPGCYLDIGKTRCDTQVTWSAMYSPRAGIFIDDNPNYWTGTPGTKTFVWTSTNPSTLRVRLDKHDPSSKVLAEAVAVAASAPVALHSGGVSYLYTGLGSSANSCERGSHALIKYYNDGLVRSQLIAMRGQGMQAAKIGFFFDRNQNEYTGVLPLINNGNGFGIEQKYINNWIMFLKALKETGFERVVVSLGANGQSHPKNSFASLDQLSTEAISLWRQIVPTLESSGLNFYIDVYNEGIIPDTNNPQYQRMAEYARLMWKKYNEDPYLTNFVNSSSISMILSSGEWDARNRTAQMPTIFGGVWPGYYDFHIYGNSSQNVNVEIDGITKVIDYMSEYGIPARPWIIGETYHNDQISAANIRNALIANGTSVEFLLSWPISRSRSCAGVDQAPPYKFINFRNNGF